MLDDGTGDADNFFEVLDRQIRFFFPVSPPTREKHEEDHQRTHVTRYRYLYRPVKWHMTSPSPSSPYEP